MNNELSRALTNDLERMIRFYRTPILTAMGLSLRLFPEDRFSLTDDRQPDERRGVIQMERLSQVRRLATKLGQGLDDRYFIDMGGNFMFAGLPNEEGQVVPLNNTTIVGGRVDDLDVAYSHTGSAQDKIDKVRRYVARKPQEINWRVRMPVLIAERTSVIDYLAFRCNKLPFLHSIAIKWGERRWDPRRTPIGEDLFRPDGEDSQMIILAPVWMDETMTRLDPNIWGIYEPIVSFNYLEYLGRRDDEYTQDLSEFLANYHQWSKVIDSYSLCRLLSVNPDDMSDVEEALAMTGRAQRLLRTTANRVLHIPFDARLRSAEYTFRSVAYDAGESRRVTEDIFNFKEANGDITYSNGFLASTLELDGWFHYGDGSHQRVSKADTPDDEAFFNGLPAVTTDFDGEDVKADHFMRMTGGFAARRMVLPDGNFVFEVWVKTPDHPFNVAYNMEVIRNTRMHTKKALMGNNRVLDMEHFRESYETVAQTRLPSTDGEWQKITISFRLKDHFFVKNESYPAHEVYLVFSMRNEAPVQRPSAPPLDPMDIGPMDLFYNLTDHDIRLVNTAQRYQFSNLLPPNELLVNLEKAFTDDIPFQGIEQAVNQCRFDGNNLCTVAEHRNSYNLRMSGTTINTWMKMNSEDEEEQDVLGRRGSFTLFQKLGNLPQYNAVVNGDRRVSFTYFTLDEDNEMLPMVGSSQSYHNHLLNPSVFYEGFDWIRVAWPETINRPDNVNLPFRFWPDQRVYRNYRTCFRDTGLQPREWFDDTPYDGNDIIAPGGSMMVVPINELTFIGGLKNVRVQLDDPYLHWGGANEVNDAAYLFGGMHRDIDGNVITIAPGTHVTLWRYFEWHARRAYGLETEDVEQAGVYGVYASMTNMGYIFSPIANNRQLLEPPTNYGQYDISPGEWSPRFDENASPSDLFGQFPWPVSPCKWGETWPRDAVGSTNPYAGIENPFSPWSWSRTGKNVDPLTETWPVFLNGRVVFDRWFNFSFHGDQNRVEFYINGLRVMEQEPEPGLVFTFNDHIPNQKNLQDLWIGTTNPLNISTCSPISMYSFKIFQRKLLEEEALRIVEEEGINFNDYQFTLYGDYLDLDQDNVLDFWQDGFSDIGVVTEPIEFPWLTSPEGASSQMSPGRQPWPKDLTKRFGATVIKHGDSILIPPISDRNYNLLVDEFDDKYINELIEIQRNGYSDGLIFWDFYHEDQEKVHEIDAANYINCQGYVQTVLPYQPWLLDKITTEFQGVRAVTDVIPYLNELPPPDLSPDESPYGSPKGNLSRWPAFGDSPDDLLLSGVKGWFGFQDIMGYRDSLAKVRKEGIIFNYIQVEFRFRADRATLEAHLKDYAQDYDDLYFDRFDGNVLKGQAGLIDPEEQS